MKYIQTFSYPKFLEVAFWTKNAHLKIFDSYWQIAFQKDTGSIWKWPFNCILSGIDVINV